MDDGLEIYVRPSGDDTFLNIHASGKAKKQLLSGLKSGSCDGREMPIHVELSVLPEWLTEGQDQAREFLQRIGPIHVRIPISAINVAG